MKKPLLLLALLAAVSTVAWAPSTTPATVVDLAAGNAEFSTLVSAVQTAGLAEISVTVIDTVLLPPTE